MKKKLLVWSIFFLCMWIICADSPSCKNISAHVGSTARLPCDCSTSANQKPVFRWHFKSEFVIESDGTSTAAGSGYEERVEVSKEDLQGGDCSLLLKNIKSDDSGAYQCNKIGNKRETVLQKVCLSVEAQTKSPNEETPEPRGGSGFTCSSLWIVALLLLSYLFLLELEP
ncbi:hypothetical protein AMEX_G4270 [Astyanax mexicanus]|uniref:Ig-like domain-containing protein n=1 Tax=Astyanax mexicanus TaxID=7994 RepID=A0A8T2ML14_ASTMX|nr:hypothetical protein AMEX_G4270 [Astyanax mexicanus]